MTSEPYRKGEPLFWIKRVDDGDDGWYFNTQPVLLLAFLALVLGFGAGAWANKQPPCPEHQAPSHWAALTNR